MWGKWSRSRVAVPGDCNCRGFQDNGLRWKSVRLAQVLNQLIDQGSCYMGHDENVVIAGDKALRDPAVLGSTVFAGQALIHGNTEQKLAEQFWSQAYSTSADTNPFIIDATSGGTVYAN